MPTENSWISETLVQFTRSPVWRVPVNDFIDDNCGVFDNEDEMKFEYTTIHNQFKKLVDGLLTNFVNELGVSLEDALAVVKTTLTDTKSDSHKPMSRLMKYIFTVEDFRSFHIMMVKRNIELDILATSALQSHGIDFSDGGRSSGDPVNDESRRLARDANGDVDEDTALMNAIAASLADQGMASKKLELEDAQLREALALSVQAEEEKARQSAARVEKEVQQVGQHDMAAAQQLRVEKLSAIEGQKEQSIQKLTAHNMEARKKNEAARSKVSVESTEAPVAVPTAAAAAVPATAPAPVPAPKMAPAAPAAPAAAAAPVATAPAVPAPAPLAALPPIGGGRLAGAAFGAGGALPPIQSVAPTGSAPSLTTAPTVATKPAAAAQRKPTQEELEARAKHMKEQRALILAQNKEQRQQELTEFANKTGSVRPDSAAAAQKQLTVDIARRLREDMVREATKNA